MLLTDDASLLGVVEQIIEDLISRLRGIEHRTHTIEAAYQEEMARNSSMLNEAATQKLQQKSELQAMREEVETCVRIAQDSTSRTIEKVAIATKPDLDRLNQMLHTIDFAKRNDRHAARVIQLSSSYLAWIDLELKKLDALTTVPQAAEKRRHEGMVSSLESKMKRSRPTLMLP